MPPVSEANVWSIDTLKQHFDQRLVDQDKAVQAALAAAEKAVSAALVAAERAREAAEANSEKWRQNANEWRAAMQDREARFASRVEIESELRALDQKITNNRSEIDAVKLSATKVAGAGVGAEKLWAGLVGMIFLLLALYAAFHRGVQ